MTYLLLVERKIIPVLATISILMIQNRSFTVKLKIEFDNVVDTLKFIRKIFQMNLEEKH